MKIYIKQCKFTKKKLLKIKTIFGSQETNILVHKLAEAYLEKKTAVFS